MESDNLKGVLDTIGKLQNSSFRGNPCLPGATEKGSDLRGQTCRRFAIPLPPLHPSSCGGERPLGSRAHPLPALSPSPSWAVSVATRPAPGAHPAPHQPQPESQVLAPRRAEPPPHLYRTAQHAAFRRTHPGEGAAEQAPISLPVEAVSYSQRCSAAGTSQRQVNPRPRAKTLHAGKVQVVPRARRLTSRTTAHAPLLLFRSRGGCKPFPPGPHRNLCVRLQGPAARNSVLPGRSPPLRAPCGASLEATAAGHRLRGPGASRTGAAVREEQAGRVTLPVPAGSRAGRAREDKAVCAAPMCGGGGCLLTPAHTHSYTDTRAYTRFSSLPVPVGLLGHGKQFSSAHHY
ncbi:uncharacterized protein PRD47_002971 [Ara ararauna]